MIREFTTAVVGDPAASKPDRRMETTCRHCSTNCLSTEADPAIGAWAAARRQHPDVVAHHVDPDPGTHEAVLVDPPLTNTQAARGW